MTACICSWQNDPACPNPGCHRPPRRNVTVAELERLGVVQELNRRLLHILGLDLVIDRGRLVVRDCRDVPGGPVLDEVDLELAERFHDEWVRGAGRRMNTHQFVTQRLPEQPGA